MCYFLSCYIDRSLCNVYAVFCWIRQFLFVDELDKYIFIATVSRELSDFIILAINVVRRISHNSRIFDYHT